MPISVSRGHFALRYEVPKFLPRGGHLCMAVLTIAVYSAWRVKFHEAQITIDSTQIRVRLRTSYFVLRTSSVERSSVELLIRCALYRCTAQCHATVQPGYSYVTATATALRLSLPCACQPTRAPRTPHQLPFFAVLRVARPHRYRSDSPVH